MYRLKYLLLSALNILINSTLLARQYSWLALLITVTFSQSAHWFHPFILSPPPPAPFPSIFLLLPLSSHPLLLTCRPPFFHLCACLWPLYPLLWPPRPTTTTTTSLVDSFLTLSPCNAPCSSHPNLCAVSMLPPCVSKALLYIVHQFDRLLTSVQNHNS